MRSKNIGGHVVEFYDSIDVMKTARLMQFNKFVVLEAISPEPDNIDRMDKEILHWAKKKDYHKIDVATKNRNQSYHFALNNINPGTLSHACWIASIDGKKIITLDGAQLNMHDHSDEGIMALARQIEKWDTRKGIVYQMVDLLKKKLITSLKRRFHNYIKKENPTYSIR